MSEEARLQRARERRRRIVIRRAALGESVDVVPVAGADAMSLAARLSREAWTWAGRDLRRPTRQNLPYRFVPNATRSNA